MPVCALAMMAGADISCRPEQIFKYSLEAGRYQASLAVTPAGARCGRGKHRAGDMQVDNAGLSRQAEYPTLKAAIAELMPRAALDDASDALPEIADWRNRLSAD